MKFFDTLKYQQRVKESILQKTNQTHQELSIITNDYSIQKKHISDFQIEDTETISQSQPSFFQFKNQEVYKNKALDILLTKPEEDYYQKKLLKLKTLIKTRSRLFDWFIEITNSFRFSNETLIRSFKIFDQLYLNDKIILNQKELHFFGIGCLLMATKLHEKKQLSIKQAIKYLSFGQFNNDNLLDLEIRIFNLLNGKLF